MNPLGVASIAFVIATGLFVTSDAFAQTTDADGTITFPNGTKLFTNGTKFWMEGRIVHYLYPNGTQTASVNGYTDTIYPPDSNGDRRTIETWKGSFSKIDIIFANGTKYTRTFQGDETITYPNGTTIERGGYPLTIKITQPDGSYVETNYISTTHHYVNGTTRSVYYDGKVVIFHQNLFGHITIYPNGTKITEFWNGTKIIENQQKQIQKDKSTSKNIHKHIPFMGTCAPGFVSLDGICVLNDRCGPGVYPGKICVMDGLKQQYLRPLQQKYAGLSAENIICAEGKELIFKTHNALPACVNSNSVEKLLERGWSVNKPPIACTLEYAPICGLDGITYGNQCMLQAEHMALKHQGECGDEEYNGQEN